MGNKARKRIGLASIFWTAYGEIPGAYQNIEYSKEIELLFFEQLKNQNKQEVA